MTMPWWGWLIAAGLIMICATWVTIVIIAGRNVRGMHNDWNAEREQWRRDHGLGRRR